MCGVGCVGIGADYDGVPDVPEELEDVSTYPVLFAALMEDGSWTEEDLIKLANGNILRVMRGAEAVRDEVRQPASCCLSFKQTNFPIGKSSETFLLGKCRLHKDSKLFIEKKNRQLY